jgi:hypothetical protein
VFAEFKQMAQEFKESFSGTFQQEEVIANEEATFNKLSNAGLFLSIDKQPFCLDKAQVAWLKWLQSKQNPLILFLGARGVGKTEVVLIYDTIFTIAKNPLHTELLIVKDRLRGVEVMALIKLGLEILGVKLQTGGKTYIRTAANKTKTPSVFYKTMGSTSFRGHRATRAKLEDLLDEFSGYSPAQLRRAEFVVQEAQAIAKQVLIIGQYANENDVVARLEKTNPTLTAWAKDVPQLIWIDKAQYLKNYTLRSWGLNMEGIFYPDNEAVFSNLTIAKNYNLSTSYLVIDPALTYQNDYTAVAFGGINDEGALVVYLDGWQRPYDDVAEYLIALGHKADYVFYEGRHRLLQQIFSNAGIVSQSFNSTDNKIKRILALKPLVAKALIQLHGDTKDEIANQLKTWYPSTTSHDDVPDVLAMLARKFKFI